MIQVIVNNFEEEFKEMALVEINNEIFQKELSSKGIVLVEFFATWCNSCQQLAEVLNGVSNENSKVKFFKINAEEQKALSRQHRILSLPTVLIFKDGKMIEKVNGFKPKQEINKLLAQHI